MSQQRPPHFAAEPDEGGERLSKRVAAECGLSRSQAELAIETGRVQVDGQVVEVPGARVRHEQRLTVEPGASPMDLAPVTLLLHKPAGFEAGLGLPGQDNGPRSHGSRSQGRPSALELLHAGTHWAEDLPQTRVLQRHFRQLECFTPLPTPASGLVVYTQDRRIARKLAEDIERLEQECVVEVAGQIAEGGLQKLCHGLEFNGRPLPPIKVSWQSETRLRFALKGIRPGQIPAMCEAVGLQVRGIKRLRIGRVSLSKLPEGQWRYLQGFERF